MIVGGRTTSRSPRTFLGFTAAARDSAPLRATKRLTLKSSYSNVTTRLTTLIGAAALCFRYAAFLGREMAFLIAVPASEGHGLSSPAPTPH